MAKPRKVSIGNLQAKRDVRKTRARIQLKSMALGGEASQAWSAGCIAGYEQASGSPNLLLLTGPADVETSGLADRSFAGGGGILMREAFSQLSRAFPLIINGR
jgi:hypothetical protein